MFFDIIAILYVMSAIVAFMFAIGAVAGIIYIFIDKLWSALQTYARKC